MNGEKRVKKKKTLLVVLIAAVVLAAGGAVAAILLLNPERLTFREITDSELFRDLPLMRGENITYVEPYDAGGGNEFLWMHDTTIEEYRAYLALLEKKGFAKYTDNGPDGIEGHVYTAHYEKNGLLAVVSYYPELRDTSINVCRDYVLSEHLIDSDSFREGELPGRKTTLTELELNSAGNCFVFQLKNGHYIVNDGGYPKDVFHLLDHLEENNPNGGKPVIEAWIISHAHDDHMGVIRAILKRLQLADRVVVEGMYFTEASQAANQERRGSIMMTAMTSFVKSGVMAFRTSSGEITPLYRMREGERYYFGDLTMDVVFEQSILYYKNWTTSNAQSTILMYTVEGQKVLLPADADYECQMKMLDIFPDSYFDLTIYQMPHHGGNVYDQVTRHLTVKTVILPGKSFATSASALLSRLEQQEHLIEKSEEHMGFKEGGLVFTFPYHVGEYERLPLVDWSVYEIDFLTIE